MKKFVVKSIDGYIKTISEIANSQSGEIWLRGHSDADYQLTPTILRKKKLVRPKDADEEIVLKYSRQSNLLIPSFDFALSEFKRLAVPFIKRLPANDFEWMFLMQHYGAPTRLLDWTTNALVALYFALNKQSSRHELDRESDPIDQRIERFMSEGYADGGAAIYIINPKDINSLSVSISSVIDVCADFNTWSHYVSAEGGKAIFPICISANHIDSRIRSQSGVFTLHGSRVEPLDWYSAFLEHIHKVFIPLEYLENMSRNLKMLGISTSFIFPDLAGVAKEVNDKIFDKFERESERDFDGLENVG